MKNKNIDALRWVRIFDPIHVPRYLVEQVRDRDYTVDNFYLYHENNSRIKIKDDWVVNPFSHLNILVDEDNIVKGFLWFSVDPLSKNMVIQTFSVDKEYWFKGKAVSKLAKHIKDKRKEANLNKIFWVTNYPKHSERYGFKRSRGVLMEYSEEKESGRNSTWENRSGGECESFESPAEELFIGVTRECCPAGG